MIVEVLRLTASVSKTSHGSFKLIPDVQDYFFIMFIIIYYVYLGNAQRAQGSYIGIPRINYLVSQLFFFFKYLLDREINL